MINLIVEFYANFATRFFMGLCPIIYASVFIILLYYNFPKSLKDLKDFILTAARVFLETIPIMVSIFFLAGLLPLCSILIANDFVTSAILLYWSPVLFFLLAAVYYLIKGLINKFIIK